MAIQSAEPDYVGQVMELFPGADRQALDVLHRAMMKDRTARDAAIRAEEREACALACLLVVKPGDAAIPMMIKAHVSQECMHAIRARAQPVPAPEHGDLSSRSGAKAEGGAERAKETGDDEVWKNATTNARSDCSRCGGTGRYSYDHNHSTVCDLCCQHNMGWWQLGEGYGRDVGKWCCKAGCGKTVEMQP